MSKPFKFLKKHYLLVTSIVLLIAIGITLQVYGKSIVKQLLQQYIQRETAGNYELTYTDLDYNLLSRRVTLHQVALLPKGNVPFDRSSYSIELKRMDVQLHEILSIYTENKLHIEGIDIIEPTVSLLSGLNAKDQITVDLGNLYLLISDYIEILEIDYFNLQSGTFIYKNTDAVFENIDFQLKSFILDSIDRPNEIFYADEIDLKLQKESFILPDSTHSFNFDRFRLSTADSILAFENVTIRPLENIQADSQTVYHIDIPLLELVGIDYHKAYHEDLLTLDSVKIESPEVDILSGRKEQEGKLRDLLAKLFRSHLINVFVINDGEVTYQKNSHKIKSTLNGNIYQLKLDSTVLKKNSTWFSEIEANLRDFSYIFEDSSTIATFDDLKASTFEQSLDIQNFDLNFNLNEKRNKLIFSSIDIDGVDIMAYMREGIIHASSIVLDEPVAGIGSEFGDPSSVTASYSPDDIYRHIASFASTIKADNLQVMQADLSNANTRLSKIDFTTQNFVLDSSVHRWSNITGRDQLSLHFAMTRGDFRIMGLADYTETYQHIHISDPVIAHAQIDTLQAKATAVYIYGLTLDDFLLNQYPIADSVLLWSPHVTWALDSAAKRPAWPAFTLGKIRLIDGKLDLYYDQLLMQSNRLYGVFRQVKDSVLIEVFTIEDFTIDGEIEVPLIDFNHKDDLITLSDLSIQKQNYKLNIPEIQVFKWNQNNLLKEGHFTSAHLLVDRPNVAIKNQDTSQNFALKLPQGTKIDSVAVSQGRFSYTLFNGNDTLKVISIFDLRVENVDHTHSLYHAENLLFGESLQLELTQTAISNSSFDLKFKKIAFNQDLGKVLTENLSFQNKNQDTNIKADKAFLAKPDIPLLFDDNIFEADSLFLQGAQITWRKPIGETRAQAPFNQINLDHLDIAETDVLIDLDTTHQPFHFKNISLSAQKINVDTTTTFNLLVDNLENLSLKGENFAYPIDDGDYIVSVKQYGFDLPTGSAYFNGVTLDPQLDKLAYSNTLTFQKDWFDVEIDTLAINNFDVEAWLERKLYAIENITLQGVNATIFRDKHLPFDSLQRRALPQAIFKRQNFAMQIDTIKVFGDITYSERPKTTTDIASVSFTDLNGRILYATTRDSLYQLPMYLQASGILQQNAPFEAQVTFDMSSPKNPFRFKGKVGEMDLTSMNKLLEPIADIQIKSGLGSEASFVFDGDDDLASGTIDFRYKKLKIIILNQKTHDIQGFTQNLKTFFANSFILRKSNPRLFNFKEGVIFYTRDKKRAIFNFWSKSILSGAVSSVGINRSKRNFLKYQREKEKTDKEKEKITESER